MTAIRIIVLDGLDWSWCRAHADDCGALWRLAGGGCCAPLRACDLPLTTTAVAALLTGREAEVDWHNGDTWASSQELIRSRPWVTELNRHGLSLGLCNVPMTYPAFRLPGLLWMTSGFPMGREHAWHQPSGLDVLGFPVAGLQCDEGVGGTSDVAHLAQTEAELVRWFLERPERADVEVVWLRLTDSAGHHHWGTEIYRAAVRRAVERLPMLLEGAETVLVLSDHGMASLDDDRCAAYNATTHGPTAKAAGLVGGHAMRGVLVAAGDRIRARGELPEQRLVEVAGGLFDLLQLPPAPGMISNGPAWAAPFTPEEAEAMRQRLRALGYTR